ncbi:MAG: hypothetical protein ACLSX2_07480 [Christensenellaceae bacterium]
MMAKKKMKKLRPRKREAAPVNLADMGRWAAIGLGASVITALLLLGLAALVMKLTGADMASAALWAQLCKVLCAMAGAVVATWSRGGYLWLRGLGVGALGLALVGLILGWLGAPEASVQLWLADIGLGAAAGLGASVIVSLFRK